MGAWRALTIDLPLRLTAEARRFTSRQLEADADHLASLARYVSLEAVELRTTLLTKSMSDDRNEATTLSQDVTEAAFPRAA